MKRKIFLLSVIAFFFLMLLFPRPVFDGASEGLLLWFRTVLPTLLPFIIMSNLLIQTQAIDWIARITGPLLCRIFGVSEYASFAVLAGFLCGYPMGSKVTADLLRSGHISTQEGQYLLSFCNNTSPMFIVSYLLLQHLKNPEYQLPVFSILILTPVLCSFLFRRYYNESKCNCVLSTRYTDSNKTSFEKKPRMDAAFHTSPSGGSLIDTCIMNGFETITKVGGYIMLFSILGELIPTILKICATTMPYTFNHSFSNTAFYILQYLLIPFLEITKGIATLSSGVLSENISFILCLALTSFGGWCSVAQTQCMIQGTGLRIMPYIAEKLVTALVTSFLSYLYITYML